MKRLFCLVARLTKFGVVVLNFDGAVIYSLSNFLEHFVNLSYQVTICVNSRLCALIFSLNIKRIGKNVVAKKN